MKRFNEEREELESRQDFELNFLKVQIHVQGRFLNLSYYEHISGTLYLCFYN